MKRLSQKNEAVPVLQDKHTETVNEYARKYGRLIRVTAVEHDDVLAMFGLMTAREVGEV